MLHVHISVFLYVNLFSFSDNLITEESDVDLEELKSMVCITSLYVVEDFRCSPAGI